jgi:hypothetical protein
LLHHDNALAHFRFWFMIFSQNMRQCLSFSLCTWQTLHQQTSFSSPHWNMYWKYDDLILSRRLKEIRWEWCINSGWQYFEVDIAQ